MTTHDLELQLVEKLIQRKGEWQQIAQESGISYSWLSKFVNRHIPNPGYRTLRQLDAYLQQSRSRKAAHA